MDNTPVQSAQAQQQQAPQVSPQSLLNAMQRQRDAAFNQLAYADAQAGDLAVALQQAVGENEALKKQNAELQAKVDAQAAPAQTAQAAAA